MRILSAIGVYVYVVVAFTNAEHHIHSRRHGVRCAHMRDDKRDAVNITIEITCEGWKVYSVDKETIRLEVLGAKSISIHPSISESMVSILTQHARISPDFHAQSYKEADWRQRRLKQLQEARERGRRIILEAGTIIIHNDKLFFDSCWGSDYTRATNTLRLDVLLDLVDRIRLTDPEKARVEVKQMLKNSGKKTLQRLAGTNCVVECLGELISKIHKGEVKI